MAFHTTPFLQKFGRLFVLLLICLTEPAFSCSLYKISAGGKTVLGNNEDSWRRDAMIWFEKGSRDKFGIACFGYERKKPDPDGAMNEHGLAFDAFTMPHKPDIPEKNPGKRDFSYGEIRTIMQQCKTVDEVFAFLEKRNLHGLNGSILFHGGMLFFTDRSGKYLVVEAHKMTIGKEDKFVLANFSVAETKDISTIKAERFRKGLAFLRNKKPETTLSFCRLLSDTMSVSRARMGDGTLYTDICDLNQGLIHLYFFHDFSRRITFRLQDELAKGDHSYRLSDLFPDNQHYQRFLDYKTPKSSKLIFYFILFSACIFSFTAVFFLVKFLRATKHELKGWLAFISIMGAAFSFYCFVLLTNEAIFYFPAPYRDLNSWLITASSCLPFVLLLVFFPLLRWLTKEFREKKLTRSLRNILVINQLCYLILTGLFFYWGLFDIFP
jgi:hypothetical protein